MEPKERFYFKLLTFSYFIIQNYYLQLIILTFFLLLIKPISTFAFPLILISVPPQSLVSLTVTHYHYYQSKSQHYYYYCFITLESKLYLHQTKLPIIIISLQNLISSNPIIAIFVTIIMVIIAIIKIIIMVIIIIMAIIIIMV